MTDGVEQAGLTRRLRDAAGAHRPDRDRMLARVEQAMAEPRPAPRRSRDGGSAAPWMRVTAVATAVAGAVGLGGLAVGAVTDDLDPAQTVVTSGGPGKGPGPGVPPPPSPAAGGEHAPDTHTRLPSAPARPSGAERGRAHGGGGSRATTRPPSTATPETTPPTEIRGPGPGGLPVSGGPVRDGPVFARGTISPSSTASWTQADVMLTSSGPIGSLSVELRVARTGGVASTGSYTSAPGAMAPSVTVAGTQLIYRWTLATGTVLPPGTHTFSGRFRHTPGPRDTGGDTWTVRSAGPGGSSSVGGGF